MFAKPALGCVSPFTGPAVVTKVALGTAIISTTKLSFGATLTAAYALIARTTAITRITIVPGYTCVIRITTAFARIGERIKWCTSFRTAIVHYAPTRVPPSLQVADE
jgi:hypothetical protein